MDWIRSSFSWKWHFDLIIPPPFKATQNGVTSVIIFQRYFFLHELLLWKTLVFHRRNRSYSLRFSNQCWHFSVFRRRQIPTSLLYSEVIFTFHEKRVFEFLSQQLFLLSRILQSNVKFGHFTVVDSKDGVMHKNSISNIFNHFSTFVVDKCQAQLKFAFHFSEENVPGACYKFL